MEEGVLRAVGYHMDLGNLGSDRSNHLHSQWSHNKAFWEDRIRKVKATDVIELNCCKISFERI